MKKNTNRKKKFNYDKIINQRLIVFLGGIILLFVIIFIELYKVMIIDNNKYKENIKELANTKIEGTSSPRGRIYDRNYNIIVDNKAVKSIVFKKSKGYSNERLINLAYEVSPHIDLDYRKITLRAKKEFFLAKYPKKCNKKITKEEKEQLKTRKLTVKDLEELKINRITDKDLEIFNDKDIKAAYLYYLMNKGYTYDEKTIKNNVNDVEYAYIAENNAKLDGFNTKLEWERVYPYGDVFKTMLGNVSTTTQGLPQEEKAKYLKKGYALNDRVGLSYIEKEYEKYLKGTKDKYEVINSHELKLIKNGKRGNDIVLSIDINLQKQVEDILTEEVIRTKSEANTEYYDHSSVVIQDPNTGEILAMSSKKIVGDRVVDSTSSILTSPITPGSVVKGASMLVGYNTGAIKMGEYIVDECIEVAGVPEKCSYHTLGTVDDITALAKSSNVYQFKTAIRVNGQRYFPGMKMNFNQKAFDTYRNMYHSFGLGVKTGIDLPVESTGYSSKDKKAGNLLDFVIGQYETYTPIQLSQYISTIANNGTRLKPHLLKEVHKRTNTNKLGKVILKTKLKKLNKIKTKKEFMDRIHEGFYAVTHAPGAYGVGYMSDEYNSAGKTGTSQSFLDTDNDGVIDTETITSSFIGYAPYNKPKMSIIVTSPDSSRPSNSDFASLVTYRITQRVSDAYFNLNKIH
ncbi:MAG: penicillin-binding protein 2 [Bacilli bacterium]|nr:penicillin-binding protein 2 [Bacilli bacterium]